ncbi:hypothetical protein A0H81_13994 [Grifola frondosa]|uniref:Uncharacterized protein n=1 Tax=Grifola frondosa TaxID=5627 RepID=A0A1C7LMK7_GRIFR|nr:hypothetical protein A0H81_13994 [Grifola frondosa]
MVLLNLNRTYLFSSLLLSAVRSAYPPDFSLSPITAHLSQFHTCPAPNRMSQSSPSSPEWLQERLSTLLASPYIHFNQPSQFPGHRFGPGPVDLFSTRFSNYFTHDATGVVAGTEVDKDGLKAALLALQRKWQPDSARFEAQDAGDEPATRFAWTPKDADQEAQVTATASIREEGGAPRISSLTLDGEQDLFTNTKP